MLRTNINGIAVIYEGDPTTSGGWVLEGSAGYVENGNRLALKGHAVWCPECNSTGYIAEGNSSLTVSDIPVALDGHRVDCGCSFGSVTLIASTPAPPPVWRSEQEDKKPLDKIFDCTHCLNNNQGQVVSAAALAIAGSGHGMIGAGSTVANVGGSLTFSELLVGLIRFTPLVILLVPGDTPVKKEQIEYSEAELRSLAHFKRKAKVKIRYAISKSATGGLVATGYQVTTAPFSSVSVIAAVEKEVEGEIRFVTDLPNLPTIYWTPDGSQLPDLPSSLPNPQSDDANQPRIFINPIPQADAQGEKLEGMPIPDQPTFKDFILVFPDGSGIKPFYIALAESGEFGEQTGYSGERSGAEGLIGKDFENYLQQSLGGNGSFTTEGREFDGAYGVDNSVWYEAKSGRYWQDQTRIGSKGFEKFKSDVGSHARIAKENGATFEVHSNSPIPQHVKIWLNSKGIPYKEY